MVCPGQYFHRMEIAGSEFLVMDSWETWVSESCTIFAENNDFVLKPVQGRVYFGAISLSISGARTYPIGQFRNHRGHQ
jgi:hypothetical protein